MAGASPCSTHSPPQNLLAGENDVRMVTVLSPDEAMQDLAAGKADVAFIWGASAGWLNKTVMHGAYEVQPVNGDHMQWDATIAFPRDQKDLRDQVDRAIGGLGDSIDRLAAKYGFPAATPTSRTAIRRRQSRFDPWRHDKWDAHASAHRG